MVFYKNSKDINLSNGCLALSFLLVMEISLAVYVICKQAIALELAVAVLGVIQVIFVVLLVNYIWCDCKNRETIIANTEELCIMQGNDITKRIKWTEVMELGITYAELPSRGRFTYCHIVYVSPHVLTEKDRIGIRSRYFYYKDTSPVISFVCTDASFLNEIKELSLDFAPWLEFASDKEKIYKFQRELPDTQYCIYMPKYLVLEGNISSVNNVQFISEKRYKALSKNYRRQYWLHNTVVILAFLFVLLLLILV